MRNPISTVRPSPPGAAREQSVGARGRGEQEHVQQEHAGGGRRMPPDEACAGEERTDHAAAVLDDGADLRVVEHHHHGAHDQDEDHSEGGVQGERGAFHRDLPRRPAVEALEQPAVEHAEDERPHDRRRAPPGAETGRRTRRSPRRTRAHRAGGRERSGPECRRAGRSTSARRRRPWVRTAGPAMRLTRTRSRWPAPTQTR